jgi:hypothetical protein
MHTNVEMLCMTFVEIFLEMDFFERMGIRDLLICRVFIQVW